MMTFLATFFDLMPMALGLERGSEATVPLARAVVGGLVVSTLLGRFVLPVLYTLLIKEGNTPRPRRRWRRNWPTGPRLGSRDTLRKRELTFRR